MAEYKCTRIRPYDDGYIAHYGVKDMKWDPKKRKWTDADYDANGNFIGNLKDSLTGLKNRIYGTAWNNVNAGQKEAPDNIKNKWLANETKKELDKYNSNIDEKYFTDQKISGIKTGKRVLRDDLTEKELAEYNAQKDTDHEAEARKRAQAKIDSPDFYGYNSKTPGTWDKVKAGVRVVGGDIWNGIKSVGSKLKEGVKSLASKAKLAYDTYKYKKEHPGMSYSDAKMSLGRERAQADLNKQGGQAITAKNMSEESIKSKPTYDDFQRQAQQTTAKNMQKANADTAQRQQLKEEQEAQKRESARRQRTAEERAKNVNAEITKLNADVAANKNHFVTVDGVTYSLNPAEYEQYKGLGDDGRRNYLKKLKHSDSVRDAIQHSWYDYCEEGRSCVVLCHRG